MTELLHKSAKTCVNFFLRHHYFLNWEDENTLIATRYCGGVCFERVELKFTAKGRCMSVEKNRP